MIRSIPTTNKIRHEHRETKMATTISKQIAQQEQKIADAKKALVSLKAKARDTEAKRFQRLADKVGFFDVEISDDDFENALKKLVDTTGSLQAELVSA